MQTNDRIKKLTKNILDKNNKREAIFENVKNVIELSQCVWWCKKCHYTPENVTVGDTECDTSKQVTCKNGEQGVFERTESLMEKHYSYSRDNL